MIYNTYELANYQKINHTSTSHMNRCSESTSNGINNLLYLNMFVIYVRGRAYDFTFVYLIPKHVRVRPYLVDIILRNPIMLDSIKKIR